MWYVLGFASACYSPGVACTAAGRLRVPSFSATREMSYRRPGSRPSICAESRPGCNLISWCPFPDPSVSFDEKERMYLSMSPCASSHWTMTDVVLVLATWRFLGPEITEKDTSVRWGVAELRSGAWNTNYRLLNGFLNWKYHQELSEATNPRRSALLLDGPDFRLIHSFNGIKPPHQILKHLYIHAMICSSIHVGTEQCIQSMQKQTKRFIHIKYQHEGKCGLSGFNGHMVLRARCVALSILEAANVLSFRPFCQMVSSIQRYFTKRMVRKTKNIQ